MLTSGVVVLTLLINAPLLPLVLHWTGLARISPVKARLRAKAVRSLRRFTEHAIVDLEHDTGEMMRGGSRWPRYLWSNVTFSTYAWTG